MTGHAFQEFCPDSRSEPTISDLNRSLVKQLLAAYRARPVGDVQQSTLLLDPSQELADDEHPLFPGLSGVFVLMPSTPACSEVFNG